jgi:hypothetical protein
MEAAWHDTLFGLYVVALYLPVAVQTSVTPFQFHYLHYVQITLRENKETDLFYA